MADSLIEDGTWTLRVDKVRDGLWTAFVMRHSVVHPRFRRARFVLGTSTLSLFRPNASSSTQGLACESRGSEFLLRSKRCGEEHCQWLWCSDGVRTCTL